MLFYLLLWKPITRYQYFYLSLTTFFHSEVITGKI